MRVTVISLILSLGVWHCVGPVRRWNGNDAARVVLPAHTHPNQEEVCPWGERVSAKALYVAYDRTRSTTSFLTFSVSIPDWRTHGA